MRSDVYLKILVALNPWNFPKCFCLKTCGGGGVQVYNEVLVYSLRSHIKQSWCFKSLEECEIRLWPEILWWWSFFVYLMGVERLLCRVPVPCWVLSPGAVSFSPHRFVANFIWQEMGLSSVWGKVTSNLFKREVVCWSQSSVSLCKNAIGVCLPAVHSQVRPDSKRAFAR